jgi:hypothetical protein
VLSDRLYFIVLIKMSYTAEQKKYINYSKKNHTKLLACAGSGKTRCIIARMNKLIELKTYTSNQIVMLTFSRFTRDDFIKKVKDYDGKYISIDSISTIDKFARSIIDPNGTVDVSLLSFSLMKFLESEKISVLKNNENLKKIKTVFVDEAQDLNEIQYRIFCAMRDKLNITINMIGDPNQNIYQFRDSSDKYLTGFEADIFILTKNFRSYESIVDFSKHLRPFKEYDVTCTKGDNKCKPNITMYTTEQMLENDILSVLAYAKEEGIDYSEFAILSPTRGRMRGGGGSHGLCFISNILYKAGIKFKQFYEESIEEISIDGIKYNPEKGHVNILTYMGSKGLEWRYVILIDADICLINKRSFDKEKHKNDQYLLYVACSRAIENMFIFSKIYERNGDIMFNLNPWFKHIPDNLYDLDDRYIERFSFPKLKYRTTVENNNRVSKIIDKLNCYDLNTLSDTIDFNNRIVMTLNKISTNNYANNEKCSSTFLSKFVDAFFHAVYNIKMKRPHIAISEIETILGGDNIVSDVSDDVCEWYNKNRNTMSWEKFIANNTIPQNIKYAILNKFDRSKPFDSHIISTNGYYQTFILGQRTWIKNLYKNYIRCKNSKQIRENLFYLMVVKHSIDTQHYFHIKSKGIKYEHILKDFKGLFDDIEEYIDKKDHNFVSANQNIERWGLLSRTDLIDDSHNAWSIKCTNDISLKHTLVSLITQLIRDCENIDENFDLINLNDENKMISIKTNYINFLKGEEISYIFKLTKEAVRCIITILQNNIVDSRRLSTKLNPALTNVDAIIQDLSNNTELQESLSNMSITT